MVNVLGRHGMLTAETAMRGPAHYLLEFRILDEPTAFFSQFPEMKESKVPGVLDRDLVKHLIEFASSG